MVTFRPCRHLPLSKAAIENPSPNIPYHCIGMWRRSNIPEGATEPAIGRATSPRTAMAWTPKNRFMTRKLRATTWLRQILVHVWNAAYHRTRLASDYASAVARGRVEFCTVCRPSPSHALLPPDHPAPARRTLGRFTGNRGELRAKRVVLLLAMRRQSASASAGAGGALVVPPSAPPRPLLARSPIGSSLPIVTLSGSPRSIASRDCTISSSGYPKLRALTIIPAAWPAQTVGGVRSEDLTRLTYPDASFDLVLTSETLEHVPELSAALREIRRVLVPGGRHIFTIPQVPSVPKTFARSIVRPDGSIEDRAPRICHPGGDVGYPVFTEFGADVQDVFVQSGFEVEVFIRTKPRDAADPAQDLCHSKARGQAGPGLFSGLSHQPLGRGF